MLEPAGSDLTRLLSEAAAGSPDAADHAFALVYGEMTRLARHLRRGRSRDETLNTTALVHEAYLKLSGKQESWEGRRHFFRIAARAMRDLLVDGARRRQAAKRGGDQVVVPLDEALNIAAIDDQEVLALHEALARLETLDARQVKVVELRYFVGLTIAEVAEVLEMSSATVERDWASARAWLQIEMER